MSPTPTPEQRAGWIRELHIEGRCGRPGWGAQAGQRIDDCPYCPMSGCPDYRRAIRTVDGVGLAMYTAGYEAAR